MSKGKKIQIAITSIIAFIMGILAAEYDNNHDGNWGIVVSLIVIIVMCVAQTLSEKSWRPAMLSHEERVVLWIVVGMAAVGALLAAMIGNFWVGLVILGLLLFSIPKVVKLVEERYDSIREADRMLRSMEARDREKEDA